MPLKTFILLLLMSSSCYATTLSGATISGLVIGDTNTNFTVGTGFFQDNGYDVQQSGYIQTSTQARALFMTTAPSMTISLYNNAMYTNYSGTHPGYCSIGIVVNGSLSQINCTTSGAESQTVSLSAGTKTVELRNGFNENRDESSNILGTFLTGVTFNGISASSKITTTQSSRIVIYGDSISTGAAHSQPGIYGWPALIRNNYPSISVMSEAVSSLAMHSDVSTNGTPSSMGSRLAGYFSGYTSKKIWISHGRNDIAQWSSSAFGTAYGQLLDAIHSADSAILIYAQTPILATSDGTASAYRTEISNACSARSSYCTTVDGTAILNGTTDLDDGVHPTAAAQSKYYDYVKGVLGL